MKTFKLNNHQVEIFDNIEDLPIVRFHKYNKMMLIDSGCGSDLSDFDRHIEKIVRFTQLGKDKQALAELENIRQNVYFIMQNLSPRYLAFAVLVKSVDGKPCEDLSDDGLCRIVEMLSDVPHKELTASLEEVKKKIEQQLDIYFPRIFDDPKTKEYYDLLKTRTMSVLRDILGDKDEEGIETQTAEIFTFYEPQNYNGEASVEVKQDRDFERMCLFISQRTNLRAKDMSVSEFYNAYDYLSEQIKEQQKHKK